MRVVRDEKPASIGKGVRRGLRIRKISFSHEEDRIHHSDTVRSIHIPHCRDDFVCGDPDARGEFRRTELERAESGGWRAGRVVSTKPPVECNVKAQPTSAGADYTGNVLRIGAEVCLLLVGHWERNSDIRGEIRSVLDPKGCLDGGRTSVSHLLKLRLHRLTHLRLVIAGYETHRIIVSSEGVIVHANVVAGGVTNGN